MNKTGIHKTSIHKTNIYKKKTLGISLFLALILLCASLAGCGGAVGQQNVSAAETGEESVSAGGAGTSLTASAQSAIEGSTEAASAYATESAAMESTEAAPAYATESAADPLQAIDVEDLI